MNGLFVFLLLVILGLLVWSMIAPNKLAKRLGKSSQKNLSRKHFGIVFGGLAVVFFVLVGITAPKQATPVSKTIQLTTAKSTTPTPTTTYKTVTQTKAVPFTSTTVQDASLAQGTNQITTKGVNGVETLTYQDKYTNGKQTSQKLISDVVTTKPVTQVTSDGTYVAPAQPSSTSTSSSSSCYPTASSGNCYEPGEYCSDADHGTSGVAGDGKSITCENNDGWRWEPN